MHYLYAIDLYCVVHAQFHFHHFHYCLHRGHSIKYLHIYADACNQNFIKSASFSVLQQLHQTILIAQFYQGMVLVLILSFGLHLNQYPSAKACTMYNTSMHLLK